MASRTRFNEGTREISFRYDILDKNNNKIGEANNVTEGKVSFNAQASIHRTATFKLREESPTDEITDIIAGNTYTTLNFQPILWDTDIWTHKFYGELVPEKSTPYMPMNPEMEGDWQDYTTWEKWGKFRNSSMTSPSDVFYTTGNAGAIGWAQTIEKLSTAYGKGGIVSETIEYNTLKTRNVYFCFMYKLEVAGVVSTDKPFVWMVPSTATQANDWAGNIKVPDANITTTHMSNGWRFCEGYYQINQSGSGWNPTWTVAGGFESSSKFKMLIDCFYTQENKEVRYNNKSSSTSPVINASYSTVVEGFAPKFRNAKIFFDLVPATYKSPELAEPSNKLYYKTSTDGGSSWSGWTQATNGVNITTIPANTSSTNLRIQLRWDYERLSMGDQKARLRDVRIEFTYNARGKNPIIDKIDYRTNRLRPYMIYKDGASTVERSLGIFLLNSPKRKDEGSRVYREIEAYDQLSILADAKVIHTFETIVDPSKPITTYVKEILTGADTSIPVKFGYNFPSASVNIVPSSDTINRSLKFEAGESWLTVINTLLTFINYTAIYADGNGVLRAEPYKRPSDKPTIHTYIDDELSVIYKQAEEDFDVHDVPNVFVITQQADSQGERMYSRYFNTNEGSLSSTVNVGRYIVDYREVDQIANQGMLDSYCARIATESSQVYGQVVFRTALMPSHEYMNNVQLRYQPLNVDDVYTETDWTMDLKVGGQMEHRVRKVIKI